VSQARWYTLYTKPHAEYRVSAELRQQRLQIYLPEIESLNANNARGKRPFFPCYLFAKIDFESVSLSQVQWTPGLRCVVAFDNQPVPLPDEVIELIQRKLGQSPANTHRSVHNFKPGQTVRITSGPFQDMLAAFEGPTTPRQRVHVLLNILGRASRVQISAADIEKTLPSAEAAAPKRPRRSRGRRRTIKSAS
jgi:transcriptional antiterminator RfaH